MALEAQEDREAILSRIYDIWDDLAAMEALARQECDDFQRKVMLDGLDEMSIQSLAILEKMRGSYGYTRNIQI